MSTFPIFADALSRLHADIAVIRLVRAGLPANRISAVFPARLAPNSVCCWLRDFRRIPRSGQFPLATAGLLGRLFKHGIDPVEIERQAGELGISAETTHRLLERIEEGRIVLCVHARTESEAAVAWHIFHHVGAENISFPTEDLVFMPRETSIASHALAGIAA